MLTGPWPNSSPENNLPLNSDGRSNSSASSRSPPTRPKPRAASSAPGAPARTVWSANFASPAPPLWSKPTPCSTSSAPTTTSASLASPLTPLATFAACPAASISLVVQAQATSEIEAAGQAAKVASGVSGEASEALVVVGAELVEHGVGLLQSGGAGEAKFADQTVLAGAPGALDAAFGLGRVGRNLLDAELFERPSELSGRLFSGELFGQGPVSIVALEDAVAIAVEAERDAVSGDHGVQGAEIAEGIFGFELEVSGQDLAGGVILEADEGEQGAAALEPVMTAGIGERHHTETWAGRAARAVLPRPALLWRG